MHTAKTTSDHGAQIPTVSEKALRTIWAQQLFSTEHICTSDGRPVSINFPGIANHDGGPDFTGARITIGNIAYLGDVEIHQKEGDWFTHRHNSDPHYNRVILHVVMSAIGPTPSTRTASHRTIPLLVLHPFLGDTLSTTSGSTSPDEERTMADPIRCCGANAKASDTSVKAWIELLASERVELKLRRFEERLKQLCDERKAIVREPYPRYYGNPDDIPFLKKECAKKDLSPVELWEQLLFEGVMEGLGYSKNRWPFLSLARSMNLETLRQHSIADTHTTMALLFGAAGLLPSPRQLQEKESRAYVRPLRRRWRELRPAFKGAVLHEADWLFFRLRPFNFPTARLATICFLLPTLFGPASFRDLIGLFSGNSGPLQKKMQSLHALFHVEPDEFWRHHHHFKQTGRGSGIALGRARINEMCVNIIIPIVMLYARVFNRPSIRNSAREMLMNVPAAQRNSVTRKMERELLKSGAHAESSFEQQGLIQLFQFYCTRYRCRECSIFHEISPKS